MDYKAKLQLNNNELEGNNIDLQSILDTINTLPEAGSEGVDTSDATATAEDIVSGMTAYVNGEKITGGIDLWQGWFEGGPIVDFTKAEKGSFENNHGGTSNGLIISGQYKSDYRKVISRGDEIRIGIDENIIGYASPSQVLKGVKFTSNEGVGQEGTLLVQSYYVGNTEPSASFGNDDDLYLVRAGE